MSHQQNWVAYFYPEPHQYVMRNKPGIKDPAALSLYEHRIVTRRGYELTKNPELIAHTFDAEHFKAIHRYLFQDVYDWAGGVPHRGHVQGCECFRERSGWTAEH